MNDRSFDRIADAYLAHGPTVLPDRVLDAAFDEVHRTRQRRGLWRALGRVPSMNLYAKVAVAAVAVIAVGLIGLTFLQPAGSGGVGAPSVTPSPSIAPTPTPTPVPTPSPAPTVPPLTGEYVSERNGFSIAYPATWSSRPATGPWTTGYVDLGHPGGDILSDPSVAQGDLFLALASQPLGDRTRTEWEADIWQILVEDDPGAVTCESGGEPITIDGAAGIVCDQLALVTDGGRGYWIKLYTSGDIGSASEVYDAAWFRSVLATMELLPEDAVDAG